MTLRQRWATHVWQGLCYCFWDGERRFLAVIQVQRTSSHRLHEDHNVRPDTCTRPGSWLICNTQFCGAVFRSLSFEVNYLATSCCYLQRRRKLPACSTRRNELYLFIVSQVIHHSLAGRVRKVSQVCMKDGTLYKIVFSEFPGVLVWTRLKSNFVSEFLMGKVSRLEYPPGESPVKTYSAWMCTFKESYPSSTLCRSPLITPWIWCQPFVVFGIMSHSQLAPNVNKTSTRSRSRSLHYVIAYRSTTFE